MGVSRHKFLLLIFFHCDTLVTVYKETIRFSQPYFPLCTNMIVCDVRLGIAKSENTPKPGSQNFT